MLSLLVAIYKNNENLPGLLRDLRSQTSYDFELIIINGCPEESVVDYFINTPFKVFIIEEEDNGIYDALNKGLKVCSGKHLLVLGSDDRIVNVDFFQNLNTCEAGNMYYADIYCRYRSIGGIRKISFPKVDKFQKKYCGAAHFHHQSVIIPREFYCENSFNLEYSVHADLDYMIRCQRSHNSVQLSFAGVMFSTGGVSTTVSGAYSGFQEMLHIRQNNALPILCPGFLFGALRSSIRSLLELLLDSSKKIFQKADRL